MTQNNKNNETNNDNISDDQPEPLLNLRSPVCGTSSTTNQPKIPSREQAAHPRALRRKSNAAKDS